MNEDLDDKYYYKFKTIQSELQWLASTVKDAPNGFSSLIASETKRKNVRKMLAQVQADVKSIQDKMGSEFTPEF